MPHLLTHVLALRAGPLEFGDPMWLWALLALIPIVYLWRTSRVPASLFRKWVGLIIRVVLVLAIVCSLADTRVTWTNKGICVAFVIDQSQSVPGDARVHIRDLIKEQIDKMTKDDQFVIVEFGGDSVLEELPSPRGNMPDAAKVEDTSHTNLARALRLAMASFPSDRQKRVVLFSDGNQNQEDALREARIAGVKDVDVDVVPILAQRGNEVLVDQVIVPPHVRKDARFMVRALVTSDIAQAAEVVVYRDGVRMTDERVTVQLKNGSNVIDIPDSLGGAGGTHQYQVTVIPKDPKGDTFAANNNGYAITQVDAPGSVLLVPGASNDPKLLYDGLRSLGIPVVKAPPGGLPMSVEELANYDCVILDNVNYSAINNPLQMAALKKWVEDYGGGLVMVGGDDSFGPGGYTGTTLEDLSPVAMDVKRQKHMASLAVVVILDKSGSMGMPVDASGTEKMKLANEGAVEVAKLLDQNDMGMLGACDTEVRWVDDINKVIPMTAANKSQLISGIRTVNAGGGGIDCLTALTHSYEIIKPANTMAKHVIMFGDAQDCDLQNGCVDMAKEMYVKYGITTSVIGMGVMSDIHVPFEKSVAAAGHGQFFIADNVMNLPRLFMKDAFLVSRQAFIEDPKGIALSPYPSPLLTGFVSNNQAQLPKLYGYVGTTLKPRATLALHGKQPDEPVLAHWTIGLGKCVAFTSDSSSRWGADWAGWGGYAKFWAQVVRWVSRSQQGNGLTTTTLIQNGQGHVVVDAMDANGKPINNLQLKAAVMKPGAADSTDAVPLQQIAPGRYEAPFAANNRGTYLVAVSQDDGHGAGQLVSTGGAVMPYAEEYRYLTPNVALLKNLADASGGKYLTDLDGIFAQKPDPVRTFWPLWQVLLVIVTSALLLDIAWRRLNIADWFRRHAPALHIQRTGESVAAMKAIKSGRRDVDSQRVSMRERVEAAAKAAPAAPPPLPGATTQDTSTTSTAVADPPATPTPTPQESGPGYANRLLNAKRRAKDQIREQEQDGK